MLTDATLTAFLATADAARSRAFYEDVIGLHVIEDTPFALVMDSGGTKIRIQKVNEVSFAPYTALGWEVGSVARTVRALGERGAAFERFAGMDQDDLGIWTAPGGAKVAWFKDPDGNLLSISGG